MAPQMVLNGIRRTSVKRPPRARARACDHMGRLSVGLRLRRDVHAVLATPTSSSSTPTPCLTKCRARFIIAVAAVDANALLTAISHFWKSVMAARLEVPSPTSKWPSRNLALNSEPSSVRPIVFAA